jgi:virulence-associated protein VapD
MSVNSSYGFLVFAITDDVDAYLDYLKANTHTDIQEHLSSIGFSNSLGASLYLYFIILSFLP